MNNSEELQFAYKIKRELNLEAGRLPVATTERLRAARQRALAHQPRPVARLAVAGIASGLNFGWIGQLAPLLVLVGGLVGINYWHQTQRAAEMADIDVQVLIDDLPLNAYADKGFGAWLGRSNQ